MVDVLGCPGGGGGTFVGSADGFGSMVDVDNLGYTEDEDGEFESGGLNEEDSPDTLCTLDCSGGWEMDCDDCVDGCDLGLVSDVPDGDRLLSSVQPVIAARSENDTAFVFGTLSSVVSEKLSPSPASLAPFKYSFTPYLSSSSSLNSSTSTNLSVSSTRPIEFRLSGFFVSGEKLAILSSMTSKSSLL